MSKNSTIHISIKVCEHDAETGKNSVREESRTAETEEQARIVAYEAMKNIFPEKTDTKGK